MILKLLFLIFFAPIALLAGVLGLCWIVVAGAKGTLTKMDRIMEEEDKEKRL